MTKKKLKAGDWYTDTLSQPCVMVADGTGHGKVLAMLLTKGEESTAHARKMAAASDLLAACELMLTVYGLAQEAPHAVEVMRAAVAKAKGTKG